MSSLSRTPAGQIWISQFDNVDQAMAEYILDSLELVSTDRTRTTLREEIKGLQAASGRAVALYALMKPPRGQPFFDPDGEGRSHLAALRPTGSANVAASVIFELAREDPQAYLDHPSLEKLASNRPVDIVLVDDSCASGRRLKENLQWIFEESVVPKSPPRRLRGWLSDGTLDLHVVAYAISQSAINSVEDVLPGRRHPLRPRREGRISFRHRLLLRAGGDWAPKTPTLFSGQIRKLCRGYARRHGLPRSRELGHKGSMGYVVFEHSAPNNLPAVLNCRSSTWMPIFDDRSVPSEVRGPFSASSRQRAVQLARRDTLEKLLQRSGEFDSHSISDFRLILAAMLRYRRPMSLSHVLGLPVARVHRILSMAEDHELVANGRLTPAGRTLAKKVLPRVRNRSGRPTPLTEPTYLPYSFRADQG